MLEATVEKYLREKAEEFGGWCDKVVNQSRVGWPDRTVYMAIPPWRRHHLIHDLVETKKPGETPRASQLRVHRRLAKCGVPVYLIDTKEKVDEYFACRIAGNTASHLWSVPVVQLV